MKEQSICCFSAMAAVDSIPCDLRRINLCIKCLPIQSVVVSPDSERQGEYLVSPLLQDNHWSKQLLLMGGETPLFLGHDLGQKSYLL
jgi:hypothetical protein